MKHFLLSTALFGAWLALVFVPKVLAADGYTQAPDGYWYKDGVRYVGKKVYQPVEYRRDSYGQVYALPQKYYLTYTVAPITPATVPYRPNWREQHSNIMGAITKQKGDTALLAVDTDGYLKSLAELRKAQGQLALTGTLGSLGFGYGLDFQGSTLYGPSAYGNYSVNAVAARYASEIDMNTLLQGTARLTQTAIEGGIRLTGNQQELAGAIADAHARIVAARGPSVTASAGATGAGASARIGVGTNSAGGSWTPPAADGAPPTPAGEGAIAPADHQSLLAAKAVVDASCISCHAGAAPKGGLNLTNIAGLSAEQWDKVILRTHSLDAKLVMPPPTSGRLSADHKRYLRWLRK